MAERFKLKMKTLRFGLIGHGYFGKNYLRLLQSIGGIKLTATAAKANVNSVLKNQDIDAVVIATPASTHLNLALEALMNGKHVLLEKPMTTSLKEAKELKKAAAASKAIFMVGHQYVYNDYVRWLQDNHPILGKITLVVAEHLYPGPIRDDIGCMWDAGTHQLSMMQCLLNPGKIISAAGKSVCMNRKGIDDFTAAAIKFESGLSANLMISWLMPQKTRKLTVIGSEKTAVFDDVEEKNKLRITDRNGKTETRKISSKEPLLNEAEHFIECIRTGKKPLTGIESSYEITEWLDKIERSVNQGNSR